MSADVYGICQSCEHFLGHGFPVGVFPIHTGEPLDRMEIKPDGPVRSVDTDILVNGQTIVHETDCSAHRVWKSRTIIGQEKESPSVFRTGKVRQADNRTIQVYEANVIY